MKLGQWHHIVKQCQIIKSGFSAFWIQNSQNFIATSSSTHAKISAYYSKKIPTISTTQTVREWLAGQSFEVQYKFGVEILKKFGVKF